MRLREIQMVINENLPNLYNLKFESFTRGATTYRKIENFKIIYKSLTNLLNLNLFETEKSVLQSKDLLINTLSDEITFDVSGYQAFVDELQKICYKAEAMENLIATNLHSQLEEEKTLIISLPSRELTMDEFCNINNDLRDTFKLLKVLPDFQTEIKMENFDIGSHWLVLSFISTTAVSLFGKLVTTVQRAQVGNRQIKALDKHLESIELSEELRNTIRDAQIQANNAIYRKLTEQFLESNNLDAQSEILSQITKVTENIDKILSMGVGFEASVSASTDVANSFPSLTSQKLLDQTKLLETLKSIPQATEDSPEPD